MENDRENQLEDLVKQLKGQINSSGWLDVNTAGKLEEQNPDLIKAWKEAVAPHKEQDNVSSEKKSS